MELLVLILFCAMLLLCIACGVSILLALAAGLALFLLYGKHKGYSWRELALMALEGVKTVKNILLTFFLIGILTALWRAAGTIPTIVSCASALIRPSVFLLMTFLLNCGVSVLTGTSFGTAATMGAICAAMAAAMGMDLRLAGGAILSGVFFGDRCSPVSTSALLVAQLTGTDIFDNIKRMLRSALVPFILSCAVYAILGLSSVQAGETPDLSALFSREFTLHWLTLVPAMVILVLSVLRVNVKTAMTASIAASIPFCLFLQHMDPLELLNAAFFGYRSSDAQVGAMMNGGGIISMLKVAGIVCLSSSYSGIFQKTGLLDGLKHTIENLSEKSSPFAATLITSAASAVIACNQTLAIITTDQLCRDLYKDATGFANDLEDTAVVVAPLVPWSIAGSVPLASAGTPLSSILFACYLYLLPLWRLTCSLLRRPSRVRIS